MRLLDHSHDQHARSSLACSSHSRTSAAAGGQERRRPRPAAGALGEDVGCATAAAAAVGVMLLQAILAVAVVDAPLLVAGQDLVRCRSAPVALQCSLPWPLPAARARQSSFPLCARGNGARAPWFMSANFFAASAFSSSVPFTLSCAPARVFAAGRPAARRREVRHRPRGAALLGSLGGNAPDGTAAPACGRTALLPSRPRPSVPSVCHSSPSCAARRLQPGAGLRRGACPARPRRAASGLRAY